MRREPDVLVIADEESASSIDAAMGAVGFDRDRGTKLREFWGRREDAHRSRLTYRYLAPALGGRMLRGAFATTLRSEPQVGWGSRKRGSGLGRSHERALVAARETTAVLISLVDQR